MKPIWGHIVAFAAIGLLATSCLAADQRTQITVALSSETKIPDELTSYRIIVKSVRTDDLRLAETYSVKRGDDLPSTLAVIPFDNDSLGSAVKIEIEGYIGTTVALQRTSVVTFVKDRNLLLRMPLRMACFKFNECAAGKTCSGGQCVDTGVNSELLEEYRPQAVFADKGGSCFNEELCLANPQQVIVQPDCSFDLPIGDVNVGIQWQAAPTRLLALESSDSQEGWTRTGPSKGLLSKGACNSHFQVKGIDGKLLVSDVAEKVYVSTKCASKTVMLPYCKAGATGQSGIGAVFK
jgi:hypothetical protein